MQMLSRLPLSETIVPPVPAELVLILECIEKSPVSVQQIRTWTRRDPVLSQVLLCVQQGWPMHCDNDQLKPFFDKKLELSLQDGCLLRGIRVIIPPPGRQQILQELHNGHPGI